jgi:putative redox protein
MPTTTVRWVTGQQFVGTDQNNHSIVLSGDNPATGVNPSQMLLIALSACTAYDVVEIMAKKRMPLTMLEVVATGEKDADPPWAYQRIQLDYRLSGSNLTEKAVSQAISLSQDKYCSVAATVRGVAEISTAFKIVP